jgi:hypothetical protein
VVLKGNPVSTLTVSTIYPNPVKDQINLIITTANSESITVSVLDLGGKTISTLTKNATSGDNLIQLNTANLASGNYLLKVVNGKGEVSLQKFVKQ